MVEKREISVKEISQEKIPQDIIDFVSELRGHIEQDDIDGVKVWKDKMRIARNMRQGIKRLTEYPYPGAPDIPLPETDKIIKKQKARFVLAVSSGKNLMKVTPEEGIQEVNDEMKQKAKRANIAMNWLFKTSKMDWTRKLALSADRFLEKGHCIFKCIEQYTSRLVNKVVDVDNDFTEEQLLAFDNLDTEQQKDELADRYGLDTEDEIDAETLSRILREYKSGKRIIKFSTEHITALPDVTTPMPEKVYVPKGTTIIKDASRITNEFFWTAEKIRDAIDDNALIKENAEQIFEDGKVVKKEADEDINEKIKDSQEGIDQSIQNEDLYRIHETITWYQPSKGKRFERWAFTYFADVGSTEKALIKAIPYPYEMDGWNYVKHDNEIIDDRYRSSRGIPEQIRAIQEFMEKSVNNMLIRDEINNVPMFTVKNNTGIISDSIRFIPGQKINVNEHDDIKQLNQAVNVDVSSERILGTLKAYAEEYVGISDQLFNNATNKGGGKTLGEVQIGTAEAQFSANLDVLLWIDSVRQVYEKIFFIFQERLITPLIIGGTVITKEDFNFIPNIVVNGSLEMADKALQVQRAQLRLERSIQAQGLNIATSEDVFRAFEDYFEKDGVKEPNDFITPPAEVMSAEITAMENRLQQTKALLDDMQSEIAQADNTLRQINQQISRKSGATENAKRAVTARARPESS